MTEPDAVAEIMALVDGYAGSLGWQHDSRAYRELESRITALVHERDRMRPVVDAVASIPWIKRWQDPDGSWHIVLTPRVLRAIPRETFRKFEWVLMEMDESLTAIAPPDGRDDVSQTHSGV